MRMSMAERIRPEECGHRQNRKRSDEQQHDKKRYSSSNADHDTAATAGGGSGEHSVNIGSTCGVDLGTTNSLFKPPHRVVCNSTPARTDRPTQLTFQVCAGHARLLLLLRLLWGAANAVQRLSQLRVGDVCGRWVWAKGEGEAETNTGAGVQKKAQEGGTHSNPPPFHAATKAPSTRMCRNVCPIDVSISCSPPPNGPGLSWAGTGAPASSASPALPPRQLCRGEGWGGMWGQRGGRAGRRIVSGAGEVTG